MTKSKDELIEYIKNYMKEAGKEPETKAKFYRVGKLLGRGAFGKVSLGMHKATNQLIAMKSINKEFLEEAKKTYMAPEVKSAEPDVNENALYMVGVNEHNMVQLRVGTPYAVTLTMNNSAVRKLIKQLEAAMPEEVPSNPTEE